MRVLLINTSEHVGGAAIAAVRLLSALNDNGVKTKMLVRDKQSDSLSVVALPSSPALRLHFVWERMQILAANKFHKHRLFAVDNASCGTDITQLPEFREADVIHLHWVNQGFLSLRNLEQIVESGKPVVWTMHDMWPFTGICHYTGDCQQYLSGCGHCPILYSGGSAHDLSYKTFRRKQTLFEKSNISFVACSNWLAELARGSRLLGDKNIFSIPNAINTRQFSPEPGVEARSRLELPSNKRLLLFVAHRVTDKIKGIDYLHETLSLLEKTNPELLKTLALVPVGRDAELLPGTFPIDVFPQTYVSNERTMIDLYRAADLLLMPTLQDNLPNTIVEAMACGKPCVGFNVGGLPQMIEHQKNGWLAQYKNAADFAKGIEWCLDGQHYPELCREARRFAECTYSEHSIAMQYVKIYNSVSHADKV